MTEVAGLMAMGQLVAKLHAEAEAASNEGGGFSEAPAPAAPAAPAAAGGAYGRRLRDDQVMPEAPPALD